MEPTLHYAARKLACLIHLDPGQLGSEATWTQFAMNWIVLKSSLGCAQPHGQMTEIS